ncbi:flavin oxidoreductase [Panacibacter ginsenosidivorans]|uniref:Flavin oxidoreductase n=1 Tax=Panacibacter ginsenosidivorans TaxID=1813871 RepID=A0A5B8VA27_9BACT|nr:flavin reductase [Panacibacter ginsenosidivorans]QEC68294.1 flavin oxidoreductase [Panacibacter ginsenosidivorans]
MFYNTSEIQSWERFYRANLINSLTGFKSISLIGTINKNGQTNLAPFSSIVHIGSDPSLVGFINRPLKAAPHTIANIKSTGVYTINHVHPAFLEKAHQASAKYDASISEFDAVGLTTEFMENIVAPFVKESIVKYALKLEEIIPIKINNTFLVIGRIACIKLEQDILRADGFLDLDKSLSLCSNGADSYYTTKLIGRYAYAKPDTRTEKIM